MVGGHPRHQLAVVTPANSPSLNPVIALLRTALHLLFTGMLTAAAVVLMLQA